MGSLGMNMVLREKDGVWKAEGRRQKKFRTGHPPDLGGLTKKSRSSILERLSVLKVGGDLLSRFYAVPSALTGLTSLFGMGRGGTLLLKPP